jgi:glycosyltransferase involved in cell wall biosynthesis
MVDALIAAAVGAAWWLAALTLAVGGAVAAVNALTFRRLDPSDRAEGRHRVSILVPARDEARTLPWTLPPLSAQGADEVLVLDDASGDGTAGVAAALAATDERLRLIVGEPLPRGWSGKNWACHQLARAARGDVLVFTDADVEWSPGALAALLGVQERCRADLLTVWPRQRCVGLGERAVVPLVDMLLLCTLPAALAMRGGPASMTAANGQCMVWRREAYEAVGGHAAVRGEVLEDVRLAQRVKAAGGRVVLRLGGRLLQARMYRTYREVVRGFGKNALAAVGGRRWALVALLGVNLVTYTLPWPLAFVEARWWPLALGGVLLRAATNAMSGRPPLEALLQPIGAVALIPVVARSLRWGPRYEWRGRRYG